ncbi:HNH endonuclease signature motif containing protein [Sphingomonas abietis]|uniref:HNH endonuclease signature motif containing protein n=1 Tax=Sphingomonas abietis TaxID=3012344 RepID=A0ABY7NQW4_9SPHN|nr:HNH endonuclease signature motif containing protein [Sphingomonas abietis]WBO23944.1 HNH endonuclease signature motif containing protein [Sphingomonas abietis]
MVERLRGRAGQRQRLRRLKRTSGLCEMCRDAGRVEPATVVDHIRPLALGGDDSDGNTRNLCDGHHAEVTAEQFGTTAAAGLGGSDARGLPINPAHPWNSGSGLRPEPISARDRKLREHATD